MSDGIDMASLLANIDHETLYKMLEDQPMEPFDVPPLKKGDLVLLNNLQSKPECNGCLCKLGNLVKESGRYNVFYLPPHEHEDGIRVKPSNLIWVADKTTWEVKGAIVCQQEYMYSYMTMYIDTLSILPPVDMASIARSIASKHGVRFEDRTAELEQLQIDAKHHSKLATLIFTKETWCWKSCLLLCSPS